MYARLQDNGNLLVPAVAENALGVRGDGMREVTPASDEYARWLDHLHPDDEAKLAKLRERQQPAAK